MEDSRIIELFFERSEQAIAELSEKYGAVCRRVARNVLGDEADAEECVSDAYLAFWNAVPPERPDPLLSYLCRIVRNLALKRRDENTAKKRNGSFDVALDEIADCLPSALTVEDEAAANETARLINAFLATLDVNNRVMFVRRYWFGDPLCDIAALFDKSEHYVSVRLSRVRKALKEYLQKEGVSL